jgi:hypothetical protein
LCQRGDLEQGIAAIEQAVEEFDAVEYRLSISGHLTNLAEAKRRTGKVREAEALCARAYHSMHESSQCWLEPELLRVQAMIKSDLQPDRPQVAEEMLRNALACAQRLQQPLFEFRCLRSLRDFLGPARQDVEIERHLRQLSYLRDLDSRAAKAIRTRLSALSA